MAFPCFGIVLSVWIVLAGASLLQIKTTYFIKLILIKVNTRVLLHCQTRYVKFHVLCTGRSLSWFDNIFLCEFGLSGSFWWPSISWIIFYVAYCREFTIPLQKCLFCWGFLAEFVVESSTHLVHCLLCFRLLVCPNTDNSPLSNGVIVPTICDFVHISCRI
jgi:hypothetical protein